MRDSIRSSVRRLFGAVVIPTMSGCSLSIRWHGSAEQFSATSESAESGRLQPVDKPRQVRVQLTQRFLDDRHHAQRIRARDLPADPGARTRSAASRSVGRSGGASTCWASPRRIGLVLAAGLLIAGCRGGPGEADGRDDTAVTAAELRLRAPREARPSDSGQAAQARAAFWDAFTGQRYEAIPGLLRQLTAAFLENPRDPETALILAHAHLWRTAERARLEMRDPMIVDHLVLAEHYFEEAYRLNPDDHRIIGWLGSVRYPMGAARQDESLAAEGALLLAEGVRRYPQFNHFTTAFSYAGLPADDPRFRDALDQLWRNVDVCSGIRHEAGSEQLGLYERAAASDLACANSEKAPHNFEGFVLNLGDMLVKSGRADEAVAVYQRARLSPTYAAWPYRGLLEERIANAPEAASRALQRQVVPMMVGSAYACSACHARR